MSDRALAASLFCQPKSVFLLIETGHSSIGDARFCFWGEGELFDWPVMPFPFDAEELAIHERRRLSRFVRKASQSTHAGLAPVTPYWMRRATPLPGLSPARHLPRQSRQQRLRNLRPNGEWETGMAVAGCRARDVAGGLLDIGRVF